MQPKPSTSPVEFSVNRKMGRETANAQQDSISWAFLFNTYEKSQQRLNSNGNIFSKYKYIISVQKNVRNNKHTSAVYKSNNCEAISSNQCVIVSVVYCVDFC